MSFSVQNLNMINRNVDAISVEIIKPSTPTPHHLKNYNLSAMDQKVYRNYMPQVFFFSDGLQSADEKSHKLKHSLSEALSAYYPFAGRLVKSRSRVDCNDEGVEFQESKIECMLSEYLKKYEEDHDLSLVFPPGSMWSTFHDSSSPVIVRVNYFDCGGIAVAVCISHIFADACTLSNFMNYWAAVARQSGEQILPHYVLSPTNNDDFVEAPFSPTDPTCPRYKFVFNNMELANLKAKICSSDGQNPTRVEFLVALFYKCYMAVETLKIGSFRPSVLFLAINMRSYMDPQLPKTTLGNWIYREDVEIKTESDLGWSDLIDKIKKSKKNVVGMKELNTIKMDSRVDKFIANNYKFYACSSWCNFNSYNVNFGWGNPVQVVLADAHYGDSFTLHDTPSRDGIEVLACFQDQEMLQIQIQKALNALAQSTIN